MRAEGAWEALATRKMFDEVQKGLRERAPKKRQPARVGSRFLLSGLLSCGVCGTYTGQRAKSGKFSYYVCGTLLREGSGSCSARYLNSDRAESCVVETITELVVLVAEEIDALVGELGRKLHAVEAELVDVCNRLERLYEALETTELTMQALSPRILKLHQREDQLRKRPGVSCNSAGPNCRPRTRSASMSPTSGTSSLKAAFPSARR